MVFDKAGRSPFDLLYNQDDVVTADGGTLYTW